MDLLRSTYKPVLILVGLAVLALVAYQFVRRQVSAAAFGEPAGTAGDEPSAQLPGAPAPTATERSFDIVTLLPPDGIPAIDNPRFYPVEEADAEYAPDELVLGVTIDGASKAYSTSHLDSHEIVNDTLGGRAIAVTW